MTGYIYYNMILNVPEKSSWSKNYTLKQRYNQSQFKNNMA